MSFHHGARRPRFVFYLNNKNVNYRVEAYSVKTVYVSLVVQWETSIPWESPQKALAEETAGHYHEKYDLADTSEAKGSLSQGDLRAGSETAPNPFSRVKLHHIELLREKEPQTEGFPMRRDSPFLTPLCALLIVGSCLVSPSQGSSGSAPPLASVTMSMDTTTPLPPAPRTSCSPP